MRGSGTESGGERGRKGAESGPECGQEAEFGQEGGQARHSRVERGRKFLLGGERLGEGRGRGREKVVGIVFVRVSPTGPNIWRSRTCRAHNSADFAPARPIFWPTSPHILPFSPHPGPSHPISSRSSHLRLAELIPNSSSPMFLIKPLRPPNSINDCIYLHNILIIAKTQCLQFYRATSHPSLELVSSVDVAAPITNLVTCDTHFVTYSKSHELNLIELLPDASITVRATVSLAGSGPKLDTPLVAAPPDGLFLLVHNTPTALHFYLPDPSEPWPVAVAAVGVVQDMKIIDQKHTDGGSNYLVAVLYRQNVSFSLRYYEVTVLPAKTISGAKKISAGIVRQFMDFSDAPTRLIPVDNGVLVVSDAHIYFFTSPYCRRKASVVNSTDTTLYELNHNITKQITSGTIAGSTFVSAAKIDSSRYLLVADTGETCLVYFQAEAAQVLELRVVPLGKSTIASSVVHISNSLFFAASRLSQSVLFLVQPKDPYISIIQYFASSPPVLDLEVLSTYPDEVLVVQGGYTNGEVCKYSEKGIIYQQTNKDIALAHDFSISLDNEVISEGMVNGKHVRITSSGYSIDGVLTCADILAGVVASDQDSCDFAFVTNSKLFYSKNSKTHLITKLKSSDVQLHISNSTVLVSSWNGEFTVYNINTKKVVFQDTLSSDTETILQSEVVADSKSVFVFVLSSEPLLTIFSSNHPKREIGSSNRELQIGSENSKIHKFNRHVVVSSGNRLFTFGVSEDGVSLISHGLLPIQPADFQIVNEDGDMSITLKDSLLYLSPGPIDLNYTIFSDSLVFKIMRIPNSNYVVTLNCNTLLKQWLLKLIDYTHMKTVDKYVFSGKDKPIDFILVPTLLSQSSFLVLTRGNVLLKLFFIEKGKIKTQEIYPPSNYKLGHEPTSIMTIDADELVFLVTGDITFEVELFYQADTISWRKRRAVASLFTTKAAWCGDELMICDAIKGVVENDWWNKTDISTIFPQLFTTDFGVFSIDQDNYLVIGDARGNVIVYNHTTKEVKSLVNLGSQINVISTVSSEAKAFIACGDGGIYKLSYTRDTNIDSVAEKLEENIQESTEIGHRSISKWIDTFNKFPNSDLIWNVEVLRSWVRKNFGKKRKKVLSDKELRMMKEFIAEWL